MACCPLPVLNSCKCLHPAPAKFRPSYPAYSTPSPLCFPRPYFHTPCQCPQTPLFPAAPYGGYLSRPWETLCGRHPFQGDYKQIIYLQLGPVRLREWLWLYVRALVVYVVLPLLLVLANLTLLLYDVSRLPLLVAALVFSAYYDLVSTYCRARYAAHKERLQARTQARCSLQQVVENQRTRYNQLCFSW